MRVSEQLTDARMPQELQALCERWLYSSCLCFALPVAEQEPSGFRYRYSVWQQEYWRNFLFRQAGTLEEVFQQLLDRTRAPLDIEVLETMFGRRHRQPKRNKQRAGRAAVEVSKEVDQRERDTTVFRVRWGNLLLKIYDKSGRVLRVEVVEKRPGTRRYQCRADKLSALCGYVVVREKVLKPLMAGAAPSPVGPAPKGLSALDQRYLALQVHMRRLLQTLGLNTNPPAN